MYRFAPSGFAAKFRRHHVRAQKCRNNLQRLLRDSIPGAAAESSARSQRPARTRFLPPPSSCHTHANSSSAARARRFNASDVAARSFFTEFRIPPPLRAISS